MKILSGLLLVLVLASQAHATSIESVELLADDGGEPGAVVTMFAPKQRVQHFSVALDEIRSQPMPTSSIS